MDKQIKTEVMILGTIHGLHSNNSFYSYEDIFSIIDNFKPSVIGVEIRKEDISQPREYLNKNYPYEMIEAKFRYENQYKICGFDWLGGAIEGKLIPEKYFETLELKIVEKKFQQEQGYKREKDIIEAIDKVRFPLIMNKTAQQCNDGRYDIACEILYSQLEIMLKGTPYGAISSFFAQRQEQIDKNKEQK